jgi:hypothetical protein
VSVLEHAFADGAGDGFGEKIPSYGVFVSISGFGWRWYTLQVSVTRVFVTLGVDMFSYVFTGRWGVCGYLLSFSVTGFADLGDLTGGTCEDTAQSMVCFFWELGNGWHILRIVEKSGFGF